MRSEKTHAAHHRRHGVKHQKDDKKRARRGRRESVRTTDRRSSSVNGSTVFNAVGSTTGLFGESAVQSRRVSLSAGRAEAFRFRAFASGTAGIAQVYVDSSNTAGTLIVGVYSEAGAHPGTLLSAGSITSPVGGAWNSIPITATSIAPGAYYWLSVLGEGGSLSYRSHRQGYCLSSTSTQRNLAGLSGSWGGGSIHQECPVSAFVTTNEPVLVSSPPSLSTPPSLSSSSSPPTPPSLPTLPLPPAPPSNTALPAISGTTTEGQTLTASAGTWTGAPTSFAYQWQDCEAAGEGCVDISGATSVGYVLGASDVGHTIRVVVIATNGGGSTSASSTASAVVAAVPPPPPAAPSGILPPVVSGISTEGEALSATSGTWTGNPSSYSYQWQDCNILGGSCSNIPGATSSRYILGAGDVGQTVRVEVTATNAGGSALADSLPSVVVIALIPPAPTNLAMPAVSGKTVEGQVLSTTTGAWTGEPTAYTYQWRHCSSSGRSCSSIGGATSPDYTLTAGDVNHTMRVMVTASNNGGSSSMSSPATAPVEEPPVAAPANTVLPAISGTTTEGQTLTATAGTWTGAPTSFAYQWQDCEASGEACSYISGATSPSYVLGASDVEHTVRVLVTATNSGGSTAATSAASTSVAAVPPPPPPAAPSNTVLPAISGTATEGQTLTASAGAWTGSPTSVVYQWQDC
ncbi:MAG: hypothetical protein WBV85_11900, partial [Solirubrobacteraceae bacterium]